MVDPEKGDRIEISHGSGELPLPPSQDPGRGKVEPPTSESSPPSSSINGSDRPNEIPFSKARCIAIVITVTGASFMNVSNRLIPARQARKEDAGVTMHNGKLQARVRVR